MFFISLLAIAFGLSMDSFSVSVTLGATRKIKLPMILTLATFFTFFHILMICIGWICGAQLKNIISGVDHWVAFGLLLLIGLKMIYEGIKADPKESTDKSLNIKTLVILSLATSIDALALGISFVFLEMSLLIAVAIIGLVIFMMTFAGVYIGKKFSYLIGSKSEIVGGVLLILIGVKILIEHI